MESNNSTNTELTLKDLLQRKHEELKSDYPNAQKTRIDPAEPDSAANWLHTHKVLLRGSNAVEAEKAGTEPWQVVVQVDTQSSGATVTAEEITSAIAQANRYIADRRFDELAAEQQAQAPKVDARHAILQMVIEAAPEWALTPTVDDMFGPVNGKIEVQYDGPNLAGEHDGWDTRAQLSQTVVFSLEGEVVETLPVVPNVLIDTDHISATDPNPLKNMEAMMKSGGALVKLASDLHWAQVTADRKHGA